MTTSPLPRMSDEGEIDPMSDDFSAFVFKIQANMNKAHRDRIAFMRICSGKFDASQEVYHMPVTLLVYSIRASFPSVIRSVHRVRNLLLKEYRLSHRSISHVYARSIL